MEGVPRQFAERRVIADEDVCQCPGQRDGGDCHHDAQDAHDFQPLHQQVSQLRVIPRAVVVADDGRTADGIADVNRDKNELHIHQYAIRRHAVLAQKAHQLCVVQHPNQRAGNVAHQL